MYFQTTLAPIDDKGGFFHAIHFAAYAVGGEDTRETQCAAFRTGNIAALDQLEDRLADCTAPRPASRDEEKAQQQMADGQAGLAEDAKQSRSMRGHYAENAVRMRHSARLAASAGVWVPRHVLVSPNGRAVLGIEKNGVQWGLGMAGQLRALDLHARGVLLDESADGGAGGGLPMDLFGQGDAASSAGIAALFGSMLKGAARSLVTKGGLLPRQLSLPRALSADGTRVLLVNDAPGGSLQERLLKPGLPVTATLEGARRMGRSFGTAQGWLVLDDEQVVLYNYGDARVLLRHEMPKAVMVFRAAATPDGKLLALPGNGGMVTIFETATGKTRKFLPHTGARRDTAALPALSPCGSRFASLAEGRVCVTELADGTTTPLTDPAERLDAGLVETPSHDGYVMRSPIEPSLAFIGGKLLLAGRDGLRIAEWAGKRSFVSEAGRPGARVPVKVNRAQPVAKVLETALGAAAAQLLPHHSPGLRLKSKGLGKKGWAAATDPKAPALGASRLGGWPDLPTDTSWPEWQGRPMAFLAQIDLAEAHALEPGLRLPASGLLSFFLGCGADTYEKEEDGRTHYLVDIMLGTDAAHRGGWRVIHTPAGAPLQRHALQADPLPETFTPCSVKLAKGAAALPDETASAYEMLTLNEDQRDTYTEVLAQLSPRSDDEQGENQLLGYPQLIQFTPPEAMCELASRGMDPFQVIPEGAAGDPLRTAAADWGLLLQLVSDDNANFLWGDAGHLYFYGKRTEMEKGDFSGVWVNYESH